VKYDFVASLFLCLCPYFVALTKKFAIGIVLLSFYCFFFCTRRKLSWNTSILFNV